MHTEFFSILTLFYNYIWCVFHYLYLIDVKTGRKGLKYGGLFIIYILYRY